MEDEFTVILVGSGAVENAWAPVRRGMERVYGSQPPGTENVRFANLVTQLRFYESHRRVLKGDLRLKLERVNGKRLALYRRLRVEIAGELRRGEETAELRVRPQFRQAIDRFAKGKVGFVTTNWDRCLDQYVTRNFRNPHPPVVHVHGDSRTRSSIFLPSEVIREPYRNQREVHEHGASAGITMGLLERCSRMVVYGLSFDPLDAELGLLVADSFIGVNGPSEVVIVDPKPIDVARRLHTLLPCEPGYRLFRPNRRLRRVQFTPG